MNNRMTGFSLDPAHPNVLAPGKRTMHTLNTYLVFRDGRPYIVGNTPGGDYQVQTNLQVITGVWTSGWTRRRRSMRRAGATTREACWSRTDMPAATQQRAGAPRPRGQTRSAHGRADGAGAGNRHRSGVRRTHRRVRRAGRGRGGGVVSGLQGERWRRKVYCSWPALAPDVKVRALSGAFGGPNGRYFELYRPSGCRQTRHENL